MILDDFVMLGKTVPEPNSDGRVFVCSAGYSAELGGLVRLYPLARKVAPPRWSICRVPLERNPKDHRPESYKIRGDRSAGAHDRINRHFEITDLMPSPKRAALLDKTAVSGLAEANSRRLSLAVLHPPAFGRIEMEPNEQSPESPQLALFDTDASEIPAGAKRFPFIPRLHFWDNDGSAHRLMIRDWGLFELMRKNPGYRHDDLRAALHLTASSSLLVGNLNAHRNAWLVISVLNGLRTDNAEALFDVESAVST